MQFLLLQTLFSAFITIKGAAYQERNCIMSVGVDHVILKCVQEIGPRGGEHLRVHFDHYMDADGKIIHDEDFDHNLNIDFPKQLREPGRRYRVKASDFQLVEPTSESLQQKGYYRVLSHDIEVPQNESIF